jgi:hypothetical protein
MLAKFLIVFREIIEAGLIASTVFAVACRCWFMPARLS